MRKIITAVMITALAVSLCACGQSSNRYLQLINDAQARLEAGDYQQAIAKYDEAIALDASQGEAYRCQAKAYIADGDYAKGIDDIEKYIACGNQTTENYEWLITICQRYQQDEALEKAHHEYDAFCHEKGYISYNDAKNYCDTVLRSNHYAFGDILLTTNEIKKNAACRANMHDIADMMYSYALILHGNDSNAARGDPMMAGSEDGSGGGHMKFSTMERKDIITAEDYDKLYDLDAANIGKGDCYLLSDVQQMMDYFYGADVIKVADWKDAESEGQLLYKSSTGYLILSDADTSHSSPSGYDFRFASYKGDGDYGIVKFYGLSYDNVGGVISYVTDLSTAAKISIRPIDLTSSQFASYKGHVLDILLAEKYIKETDLSTMEVILYKDDTGIHIKYYSA